MNARASVAQPATAGWLFPAIGTEWKELGGVYAGIARGQNGAPDYHLIVGPEADKELKWKAAVEFAKGAKVDGHQDFDLPARHEQALLFANVPELFKRTWYWSNASHAEDARYAWCQGFYGGTQSCFSQSNALRARAVRRVPL